MSYRTYLLSINKNYAESLRGLSGDEWNEKFGIDKYFFDIDGTERLYCFGSYFEHDDHSINFGKFFTNDNLDFYQSYFDCRIVDKNFLLGVINKIEVEINDSILETFKPFYGEFNIDTFESKPSDFIKSLSKSLEDGEIVYDFDFTLLTNDEKKAIHKLITRNVSEVINRSSSRFYDKSTHSTTLSNGNHFKDEIYNILNILKTFDWENKYLVHYGY